MFFSVQDNMVVALAGFNGYKFSVHDKAGVKCTGIELPEFPTVSGAHRLQVFAMTITDEHVIYVNGGEGNALPVNRKIAA